MIHSELPFVTLTDTPRVTTYQGHVERVYLHITGRQTWLNAKRVQQCPLDRLGRILFEKPGYPAFSTYSMDPWGRARCHGGEDMRSWAQGYKRGTHKKIQDGRLLPPRWWVEAWADVDMNMGLVEREHEDLVTVASPLDLLGGQTSPNKYSVSIEFVQWGGQTRLTQAQYINGADLVLDICHRHDIPHNRLHVLGHEDVTPWWRDDAGGGWDPGAHRVDQRFDWETMLCLPLSNEQRARELLVRSSVYPTPKRPGWLPGP